MSFLAASLPPEQDFALCKKLYICILQMKGISCQEIPKAPGNSKRFQAENILNVRPLRRYFQGGGAIFQSGIVLMDVFDAKPKGSNRRLRKARPAMSFRSGSGASRKVSGKMLQEIRILQPGIIACRGGPQKHEANQTL